MESPGKPGLTSATNGSQWGGSHIFDYDPLDSLRRSVNPTFGDWTYVYNATTRRLDRIDPTGGGAAVLTYGYDTRGRATSRALAGTSQTFVVDLADRVTSVGPSVASYRYDGHGRRTSVTKGSSTTVQIYSQAGQLVYQSSPANDGIFRSGFQTADTPYPSATGGNKRYVYLGRHLIAEDGTAGRSYVHTDGLGSPARTTSTAGVPSAREDYKPYGWGSTPQSKPGFTGHVADAETGLSYLQARYYDPFAGRFLAVDPVDASAASFNRYWYANNNPYKNVDPDGRNPVAGAAIGCGISGPACPAGAVVGAVIGVTIGIGGYLIYNEIAETDSEPQADAQPGDKESDQGCIYCVSGEKTQSGKDYVGSTDDMGRRQGDKSDGRDRDGAERIDSYPKGDRTARGNAEQKAINDRGGVENLDNKRNEVAPKKWPDRGIDLPKNIK